MRRPSGDHEGAIALVFTPVVQRQLFKIHNRDPTAFVDPGPAAIGDGQLILRGRVRQQILMNQGRYF